ncbi:26721_t:CDS:1 [Dentiscutata erythropus]|uniref:26721_t:CDS:1 n=1 Tax=Dentiscutata erythropus TaxID=1348616 RepID=A0A9N9CZD5_9GLOM|nr:26721_t:CDS:1 [Dentiscutata erythropus]
MTNVGFYNILSYYDKGIAWLETILHQDVYKTEERNTKGRRKKNVVVHKLDIPSQNNQVQRSQNDQVQSSQSNQVENEEVRQQSSDSSQHVKRQCRHTTNIEKKILEDILNHDSFPEDIAIEILRKLQDYNSQDWDIQHI